MRLLGRYLTALLAVLALTGTAAVSPPSTVSGTLTDDTDSVLVPFTALADGPMRFDLTFASGDNGLSEELLVALYDLGTGDLLEAASTYVAYDGHVERVAIGDTDLVTGDSYVAVMTGHAGRGTLVVHDAEPAGDVQPFQYPIHMQRTYSTNRIRTIDNGYIHDTFLLPPKGEAVVALQLFATVHDSPVAVNYGYGRMCVYSATIDCAQTAEQLDHVSATHVTDSLTTIQSVVKLDPSDTEGLRGNIEMYNPVEFGIIQLNSFVSIPARYLGPSL